MYRSLAPDSLTSEWAEQLIKLSFRQCGWFHQNPNVIFAIQTLHFNDEFVIAPQTYGLDQISD
jgi:hypothetical protein